MRLRARKADRSEMDKTARRSAIFASLMLAVVCTVAIVIAFLDPYLEGNIQGMFNLAAPIGKSTILTLSAIGGIILVLLEYLVTLKAVRYAAFI